MKKAIITNIFCLITLLTAAQQDMYSWRVGMHSGFNWYRGDLNNALKPSDVSHPLNDMSYANRLDLLSYGASLSYVSRSLGVTLLTTKGVFRAEDRAMNRTGEFINHANFNRALNVETQLYDAAVLLTFFSDNGRLLSNTALVSPYISIGLGGTAFQSYTDLKDASGNTYYYWSDGNIYNYPELSVPPIAAQALTRDFIYETDVEILDPEGIFYPNLVWNIPIALGLKCRVSNRLNINIEVLGRLTSTDYLDGVSTRGNPTDNDFYGITSLSLQYNFGRKSDSFQPPVFYTSGEESQPERVESKEVPEITEDTAITSDTLFIVDTDTLYYRIELDTTITAENEVKNIEVKAVKDSMIIEEKLDSLPPVPVVATDSPKVDTVHHKVENYQSYTIINNENQVTQLQLDSLKLEIEKLRQKYDASTTKEESPKADAEKIAALQRENEVQQQEIKALNTIIATLEKDLIHMQEQAVDFPMLNDRDTMTIVPGIIQNTAPPVATSTDTKQLEARIQRLSATINRLENEVIPAQNQTIQDLSLKVAELQGMLKAIGDMNSYYATIFQEQMQVWQQGTTVKNNPDTSTTTIDFVKDYGIVPIYFDSGSDIVKADFDNALNRLVLLLQKHTTVIVILSGYADKSGNEAANLALSKRRAIAVKQYLLSKGIEGNRIDIRYFGEQGASAVNEAFARRVEIQLLKIGFR